MASSDKFELDLGCGSLQQMSLTAPTLGVPHAAWGPGLSFEAVVLDPRILSSVTPHVELGPPTSQSPGTRMPHLVPFLLAWWAVSEAKLIMKFYLVQVTSPAVSLLQIFGQINE